MNTWPQVKLKDICEVKGGKRLPLGEDFSNEGFPYIRARDIKNGKVSIQSPVFVSARVREKIKRYITQKDDILITIVGANIGDVAIVPANLDNASLTENAVKLTRYNGVLPNFLINYLSSPHCKEIMQQASAGAAQGKLGIYKINEIKVLLPPFPIQRKIAAILSAYDDLIENNNRRIAILEKMAEELYREWFVRLRFPGHEGVKIVKGVPEGWEVTPLGDLAEYLNGYAFGPDDWKDVGFPIIKIRELKQGITAETPRNSGDDVPRKLFVQTGDILFSWSGSLEVVIWNEEPGLLNQHLFKVNPKPEIPKSFLFLSLKAAIPSFAALTTGATMQHIKRGELDQVKIPLPPKNILSVFNKQAEPLLQSTLVLFSATQNLAKTRDRLLSRLMSGKIDVEKLDIAFPMSMLALSEAEEVEAQA